ncbi:hypothetical protein [Allokutzneria albata]|uniref:hypothetical protein n=1 Tax=Allokutzneria albata TaxID=211114 RepID=UPI0004C468F2|nr:hypothetical protein [Allokutzneria albata]
MLLLDNVSDTNGGHLLLRLINDVRNETGVVDPLVVISSGAEPPVADAPITHPLDAFGGYIAWERAGRRPAESAWYLPVRIPDDEFTDEFTGEGPTQKPDRLTSQALANTLTGLERLFTRLGPPQADAKGSVHE